MSMNGTGVWSQQGYSDGIVYDGIGPDVPLAPVPNGITLTGVGYSYVINTTTITWSWPQVSDTISGVKGYYVSIATSDTNWNDTVVVNNTFTVTNSFTYGYAQHKTKYYVKIKAADMALNTGNESQSGGGILTDLVAPSVPGMSNSDDNIVTYLQTPNFTWSSVSDGTFESGIDRYRLEISTRELFDVITLSSETGNTKVTNQNLVPGRYWYHVASVDKAGNYSQYIATRTFLITGPGIKLTITSSSQTIKTTGTDTVSITACVSDINNSVVTDEVHIITFTVSIEGRLDKYTVMTTSGAAWVSLSSTKSTGTITVNVYCSNITSGTIMINSDAAFVESIIELSSDKGQGYADGQDKIMVSAALKDIYGNLVKGKTVPVQFYVNEYGTIISSDTQVNPETGKAVCIIQSGRKTGIMSVESYSIGLTTGKANIELLPTQATGIKCVATPSVITADGVSISTIEAIVVDVNENIVLGSTYSINFSITGEGDFIGNSFVKTVNSIARVSVISTKKTGKIVVTAKEPNLDDGIVEINSVTDKPGKLVLNLDNNIIRTGGLSSTLIRANIADMNDNIVMSSTQTVEFSVYIGNVLRKQQSVIVSSGSADYLYTDDAGGLMTIKAQSGNLLESTTMIISMIDRFSGGYYLFDDTGTKLYFPAGAINHDVMIDLSTGINVTEVPGIKVINNTIKEFIMKDNTNSVIEDVFNKPVTLVIQYRDQDVASSDIDKLKVFYKDTSGNLVWVRSSHVNKTDKTVTAQVNHLSVYMLGMFVDTENLLFQNYPNPFCPARDVYTRIEYGLSSGGIQLTHLSIKVYNIAGDLVRTLIDKEVLPGTKDYLDWDGKNDTGEYVSDGVCLCQLSTPDYKKIIKILLIK
jgi:hypothetical protein